MLQELKTKAGIHIEYEQQPLNYPGAIDSLRDHLNAQRGALFASSFEYPGRYTCWDIGFYNPPLAIEVTGEQIVLNALNPRGEVLLAIILENLKTSMTVQLHPQSVTACLVTIVSQKRFFTEEERSKQPSVFTLIRELLALLKTEDDSYLGFYGAFGYDLIFQFEALKKHKKRAVDQRDMVLYFPDEIYVVNHRKEEAFIRRYDFNFHGKTTQGLARSGAYQAYAATEKISQLADHAEGEYAQIVEKAKKRFACGDLFEVVPSQTFFADCQENPNTLFAKMREVNPSPYGFFINLGQEEYLVGASPEMYVRVQGRKVETCPISGTIKRGQDAIEDAHNIQSLLMSEKEESELTMCTDVDRNDKSRICEAGSVQVIGRRLIEMYSRVIHTVDRVEGVLRPEFDAVDAFLTHMWVVTVTGSPKLWAMDFIETHEKSPRRWYGGAVGWFGLNGELNTGLVLRTFRIKKGIAELRVGATLLYDSNPEAEEQETRLKASAFIELLQPKAKQETASILRQPALGKRVLLIDHQDSFVHTLANYIRQTGAEVETVRFDQAINCLNHRAFDLVVLSPGPGCPADFQLSTTIEAILARDLPIFGVCLGLQAIVEYFGGKLATLTYPMHGKPSMINADGEGIFAGLPASFKAGRYHSLYADEKTFPETLQVTARSEDGIIMGISHRAKPIYAVQFHPETILSLPGQAGLRIIFNLMDLISDEYAN